MLAGVFTLLLTFGSVHASSFSHTNEKQNSWNHDAIVALASEPTWLRLLHTRQRGPLQAGPLFVNDIVSQGFYLSDTFSPVAELYATLDAFQIQEKNDTPGESAICQFPARYLWLRKMLGDFPLHVPLTDCDSLHKWVDVEEIESLSLVQVSGYFGNPASAFGHLLLRAKKRGVPGQRGLLDLGVNFGATIPENENMFTYILKGIFGGYVASFSDKTAYAQDHVYSTTENRDMWAHDLNLSREQIRFLIYHLWEVQDAKFDYYFLKNNCAFQMAHLMELVLDESFGLNRALWYAPIHVFHKLKEIDQVKKQNGKSLISNVAFVPSFQRELYNAYESLTRKEQSLVEDYVNTGLISEESGTSAAVLEFLLQYIEYINKSSEPETVKSNLEDKQAFLVKRFALPVANSISRVTPNAIASTNRLSPATGPRPAKIALGVSENQQNSSSGTLTLAPYSYQAIQHNRGSTTDSTFELLSVRFNYSPDEFIVDRFNLLEIEKLASDSIDLKSESRPAWRVALGLERIDCTSCLRPFISGGYGVSHGIGNLLAYGLFDLAIRNEELEFGLSSGVLIKPTSRLGFRIEANWKLFSDGAFDTNNNSFQVKAAALVKLSAKADLSLTVDHLDQDTNTGLDVILRF